VTDAADSDLRRDHLPAEIRRRLGGARPGRYLSDAVLGGIDGCVTTFAIVAGAVGAAFPPVVALVLGFANLLADGFSMAVSQYEALGARRDLVDDLRRTESHHIDRIPEGEREEIREIFRQKGFEGTLLEQVVETICANRQLWIETMLAEEHGIERDLAHPLRSALATFAAFVAIGALPLVPLFTPLALHQQFVLSSLTAAGVFFAIGMAKGVAYARRPLYSALRTLLNGCAAAALAFLVGHALREVFGVA
jgi:VIT1/CCC1 family predicted Fe2+/Mn2+ transporter